jgi:serine/threonine protein kinase
MTAVADDVDAVRLERARARVGSVLRDKLTIDGVLGVGGMAVVYAATHRNRRRFAVKMLHPELSAVPDIRARFLREGYAANSVDHPCAVAVVDDDVTDDGAAFLVMELLEGASLEALWERLGPLPPPAVTAAAHALLDLLDCAHAKGIVHRDIKPANLFVTRAGALKVLDFGIARVRDAAVSSASATSTGTMLGTPAFMAPEQALGNTADVDERTDVWAVGATMFTLLSGRYVHDAQTAPQMLIHAATRPAPALGSVAPHVPAAVRDVVDRALAFEKAARWPSAREMGQALAEAHRACFGADPGPQTLAAHLGHAMARPPAAEDRSSLEQAATGLAPAASSSSTRARPQTPRVGRATATAAGPMQRAGSTTAEPVSQSSVGRAEPPAPGAPVRRARVVAAMGAAGVLAAAVFVGVRHQQAASGSAPAAAPSATALSTVPATPQPPPQQVPAASPVSPPTPPETSASLAPAAADAPAPAASAPARAAHTAPPPPTAHVARAAPAAAKSARPATSTPAPSPACTVVADYDPMGHPIFRKECH